MEMFNILSACVREREREIQVATETISNNITKIAHLYCNLQDDLFSCTGTTELMFRPWIEIGRELVLNEDL